MVSLFGRGFESLQLHPLQIDVHCRTVEYCRQCTLYAKQKKLFVFYYLKKVKYLLHISLKKRNFALIIKFIPHRE